MKKYNVYFSFSNEFSITFQEGNNPSIKFKAPSKNALFQQIQNKADTFNIKDSFSLGSNSFSTLANLLNHLQNKGENIRFIKNFNLEQKVLSEKNCDKCGGSGDSDKRDVTGDFMICQACGGPGKIKIWG